MLDQLAMQKGTLSQQVFDTNRQIQAMHEAGLFRAEAAATRYKFDAFVGEGFTREEALCLLIGVPPMIQVQAR